MKNTFAKAVERLNSYTNYEQETPKDTSLGTRSIETLWQALDFPSRSIPTIHIAGTKGKGSTAWYAGSLLRATGLRVGVYTSPHLVSVCERISINGIPVSEEMFAKLISKVCDAIESVLQQQVLTPTWFDIVTVMALQHFQDQQMDAIVLETGLGGRLDSTNVCEPKVTVITRLGLDHTHILGETFAAIAMEKGGIIKKEVPLVTLHQDEEAMRILKKLAELNQSPLKILGKDFFLSAENEGMDLDTGQAYYASLRKSTLGFHQWENIALAIMAVEIFCEKVKVRFTEQDARFALLNTEIPGRAQKWQDLLLDGAHNPLAMRSLVDILKDEDYGKMRLIIGMCADKNIYETLEILKPWVNRIWCVPVPSPRSLSSEQLKACVQKVMPQTSVEAHQSIKTALELARAPGGEDPILVTGSFYLIGEVLKVSFEANPLVSSTREAR